MILARVFSFVMLGLCIAGCGRRAWTTADPWYSPRPLHRLPDERQRVPVAEVKASARGEAARRLADASVIPLSAEEATGYLDRPLDAPASHNLYLVRGVYLNRGTGSVRAYFDGRDLTVHHGSLGRRAVPMRRQPLVVALPTQPHNLYVTASMAE